MIYSDMTKKALNLAYKMHEGQIDRLGIPYIFHPYHVAEQMKDETTATIALLHDIIEDTAATEEMLWEEGFPAEVIEAVVALTHDKEEDYFLYIERVGKNELARAVKLADLEHNSDRSRIVEPSPKDILRYEKYEKAKEMLLFEKKHDIM